MKKLLLILSLLIGVANAQPRIFFYANTKATIVSYDPDAQAFFTATGITDATIKNAVNTLVLSAKANGWWSKCIAIYPMVGGTSSTCAVNLKSPGTFDLTFTGSWTISSDGIQGDGSTTYANTGIVPSTDLTYEDTHISIWSRTNVAEQSYDMGAVSSSSSRISFHLKWTDNNFYGDQYNSVSQRTIFSNSSTAAYFLDTRTSSTDHTVYRNGISQNINSSINTGSLPGISIYIGNANGDLTGRYSTRQYSFASVGDGISSSMAADMYSDIQTFQTALSR
jgi:hypothetical protein